MLKKHILNLAILYSLVLLVMSLVTLKLSNNTVSNSDKLFHATAHFVFVVLWSYSLNLKLEVKKNRAFLLAFLLSIAFGIVIEVLQELFTTTREADFNDVIANIVGALLGVSILTLINRNK